MHELLRYMQTDTDVLIIDTPPVMAASDPVILSPRVDGVIVIVRLGETKLAALDRAVEQLQQVGANILGIVLNAVDDKSHHYYYNKGYYRYHYGTDYGKKRKFSIRKMTDRKQ